MAGNRLRAALVHVLTASGVIPAFLAFIAVSERRYEEAFAWLGLALVIDGVDGPLARRFDVKNVLPRFCGERLDLIVDYLTYVVIPAYMVYHAPLVPPSLSTLAATMILLSSLYHFSDTASKTDDGFFVGFPAIWNLAVFYLLAFAVPPVLAFLGIAGLTVLTFVPLKWLHPVRVERFRVVTFGSMALWAAAAVYAVVHGFPTPGWVLAILAITGAYAVGIGLLRSSRADPAAM